MFFTFYLCIYARTGKTVSVLGSVELYRSIMSHVRESEWNGRVLLSSSVTSAGIESLSCDVEALVSFISFYLINLFSHNL